MPWVRIDEKFAQHPKVRSAGPLAIAMQVAGLCYCNEHLTDGVVPRTIASALLDLDGIAMRMWSGELVGGGEDATWELVVEDLVAAGMWEPVEGGWYIHDFRDYQPTKREVTRQRKQKAAAGRKGGLAKAQANGLARAKQMPSKRRSKLPSENVARTRSRVESSGVATELGTVTNHAPPPPGTNGDESTPQSIASLLRGAL